jgi:hypothetical protein
MKTCLLFIFLSAIASSGKSQKIDSIFVHLYTDSLKKGTYNYINVDGKYSNGRYLPLDTSDVIFKSSHGIFHGNSLYLDPDCKEQKVHIVVKLRSNEKLSREFDMYLKKNEDPARLKTVDELMDEMDRKSKRRKG